MILEANNESEYNITLTYIFLNQNAGHNYQYYYPSLYKIRHFDP